MAANVCLQRDMSAKSHVCKESCLHSNLKFLYRNDCAKLFLHSNLPFIYRNDCAKSSLQSHVCTVISNFCRNKCAKLSLQSHVCKESCLQRVTSAKSCLHSNLNFVYRNDCAKLSLQSHVCTVISANSHACKDIWLLADMTLKSHVCKSHVSMKRMAKALPRAHRPDPQIKYIRFMLYRHDITL